MNDHCKNDHKSSNLPLRNKCIKGLCFDGQRIAGSCSLDCIKPWKTRTDATGYPESVKLR